MVAGKWRHIAFAQISNQADDIQEDAIHMIGGIMNILSCAGWAGETKEIQQQALQLMTRAGKIRADIKGGIISADCQPWIAAYGDEYDTSTMRNADVDLGLEVTRDNGDLRVLGSTRIGLKIGEKVRPRTRVFVFESFRERRRFWTQLQTHGAV